MKSEIWLTTYLDNPNYEVSNFGRVRHKKNGTILKPCEDRGGYLKIRMHDTFNHVRKNFTLHRLVMKYFVGNKKLEVDHINDDRTDNRLENLQYVTKRQNLAKRWKKFEVLRSQGIAFKVE